MRVRAELVHDAALALGVGVAGKRYFERGDVAVAEVRFADDFGGNDFAGGGENRLADDAVFAVAQNVAERENVGDDAVGGFELGETDRVCVSHGIVETVH